MWRKARAKAEVDERQAEALAALEQTETSVRSSLQRADALQRSVAALRRLNQENGFAPRLEMAFRGEQ